MQYRLPHWLKAFLSEHQRIMEILRTSGISSWRESSKELEHNRRLDQRPGCQVSLDVVCVSVCLDGILAPRIHQFETGSCLYRGKWTRIGCLSFLEQLMRGGAFGREAWTTVESDPSQKSWNTTGRLDQRLEQYVMYISRCLRLQLPRRDSRVLDPSSQDGSISLLEEYKSGMAAVASLSNSHAVDSIVMPRGAVSDSTYLDGIPAFES